MRRALRARETQWRVAGQWDSADEERHVDHVLEIFLRNMRAKFPLEMKEVILDVDDDERGASIVRT